MKFIEFSERKLLNKFKKNIREYFTQLLVQLVTL